MGFGDVDDDYDPARPNDYMVYCRERIDKKRQEERDRELKIIMEEQEREVWGMNMPSASFRVGIFCACGSVVNYRGFFVSLGQAGFFGVFPEKNRESRRRFGVTWS